MIQSFKTNSELNQQHFPLSNIIIMTIFGFYEEKYIRKKIQK